MEGIKSVNVRFPNESMYDKVYTFNLEDFELKQVFKTSVFGKWIDIYVFVDIDDYNRLKDEQINR
jgi:hypothetical protein